MFSWELGNFGIDLVGKFAKNYHLCIVSVMNMVFIMTDSPFDAYCPIKGQTYLSKPTAKSCWFKYV